MLGKYFPEQYNERAKEIAKEEEERGDASMDVDPLDKACSTSSGRGGQWDPSDFTCNNPQCGKLLYQPVVLSCGHVVCRTSCLPDGAHGSSVVPAPPDVQCPACGTPVIPTSAVCMKLQEALHCAFPDIQEARKREEEERRRAGQPGNSQTTSMDASESTSLSEQPPPGSGSDAPEGLSTPEGPSTPEGHANEISWLGVGCDMCGMYPLVGRRFKCEDCPEKIGYDLCGSCYESNLAGRGRFNQNHLPTHTMREVLPTAPRTMRPLSRDLALALLSGNEMEGQLVDEVEALVERVLRVGPHPLEDLAAVLRLAGESRSFAEEGGERAGGERMGQERESGREEDPRASEGPAGMGCVMM